MRRIWRRLGFIFTMLAATATAEDLTVTSNSAAGARGTGTATAVEHLYVSDRFVRIVQPRADWIIDASSGRMTMIDPTRKTYFESSYAELATYTDALMPKSGLARGMAKKMFANLTIQKEQDHKTIAGYDCEHYVERGGPVTYHVWATTAITPPPTYYDVMEKAYAATSPIGNPMTPIYEHMRKVGATPLEIDLVTSKLHLFDVLSATMDSVGRGLGRPTPRVDLKATESTQTVMVSFDVSRDPIPPETFETPPGLAKIDSPYAAKRR